MTSVRNQVQPGAPLVVENLSIIKLKGELDSSSASNVRQQFVDAVGTPAIVIDMREVAFVDSAGLGAIVGGARKIRQAGGCVVVCCTRRSICRLLNMTGFDRLVMVTGSLEEAITAAGEGAEPE